MTWLREVFHLFYPNICFGCEGILKDQKDFLCTHCLLTLDFIPRSSVETNEMKRRFYGKLAVTHCVSTLFYTENSITQKLLHQLKYKNQQEVSTFFAVLTLQHLKNHFIFQWADVLVPVPLHQKKLQKRGYNQLDGFGKHLSKHLQIPYCNDYLIKLSDTKSQTNKNILERSETKSIYQINPKYIDFKNQNILLIDDVMTTGSTLEIIGNYILRNTSNKISILTMAYTR